MKKGKKDEKNVFAGPDDLSRSNPHSGSAMTKVGGAVSEEQSRRNQPFLSRVAAEEELCSRCRMPLSSNRINQKIYSSE